MFVKKISRENGSISVQIVENKRVQNKVIQKTIQHLGQYTDKKRLEQGGCPISRWN